MRYAVRFACLCLLLACLAVPAAPATAKVSASERMLAAVNKVRAKHGLRALRASPSLSRSSRRFGRWMLRRDFFGHRARVSANHRRFRRLGEAIAMHSGRKRRIAGTLRGWLRSPSHRALVLTRSRNWIGASMVRGRFGGTKKVVWVLQVGKR